MEGTEVRSIKRLDGPTDRSTDPLNDRPSERTTARTTDRTSERKTDLPTETLAKRPAYDYLRFTNDIFGHGACHLKVFSQGILSYFGQAQKYL